ncbi:MAG: diguanylate cyclase [Anaerolineales bacterium]|uniref:diguanylate cyclase domain-containing protein n=1 Tax=Candidatus Villigracilis proximus TaxID=3140683 RepID=UPI003135E9A1|nr:diguanylate cyclase [Anaerolineales bacterium]MBK8821386.1 diguanylate cyclase [Anaerolineales bacterium]MBK9209528.1 diguanylate cyclase [Anaerolineales bacterium]
MTNLKRSFFWIAFYLLLVLVLGQLDRSNTPIINFAAYFYLTAIIIVPVMIFVPSLHKVSVFVPMFFWGAIYFALFQIIDRELTATLDMEVIILEIVILEVGVWLSYQLAVGIESSESLMDALAQGTFPHRALEMESASEQLKIEFARSRRYHRPLSLLVVHAYPKDEEVVREMLKSLQHDVLSRLSNARIGQSIGEAVRQTDLLIRDHVGRFVILCPETDLESAIFLAERICKIVEERAGLHVNCGVASFPDEALTFEDLLHLARDRSKQSLIPQRSIDATEKAIK